MVRIRRYTYISSSCEFTPQDYFLLGYTKGDPVYAYDPQKPEQLLVIIILNIGAIKQNVTEYHFLL